MDPEYFDEILCPFTDVTTGKKCGKSVQCHQKFCSECGCKIDPSWFLKQTTSPQVDMCTGIAEDGSVCGWQLDSSVKFCCNCGARSKLNCIFDTVAVCLSHLHCVSEKSHPFYFYDNFIRCRPI